MDIEMAGQGSEISNQFLEELNCLISIFKELII
jgi:hypothetical protein